MNARRLALCVTCLALVTSAWRTAPRGPAQDVEFEVTRVAGSIYLLDSGIGGNIGLLVGDEAALLIDNQFERTATVLAAALAGVTDRPIEFLLNTHYHADHTGGNPFVVKDVTILAHENVRARLQQPGRRGPPSEAMLAGGLPVVTFDESLTLHFAGQTLRVEHFPAAHTDGDSAVFFEEANVVHTGDVFFSGRFPYIDLEAGGSSRGTIDAVTAILARIGNDTQVIPGHGPLASKADLEAYRAMLVDARAKVSAARAAGQSAEDMKRENLLAEYADWSWGFISAERFIDTLAAETAGR